MSYPQWMTDELLEQWERAAMRGVHLIGALPADFTGQQRIAVLIAALRAARANQATEAERECVAACLEYAKMCDETNISVTGPRSMAVLLAGRAVIAERTPKPPKPRYTASNAHCGQWCVRDEAEAGCRVNNLPLTESQARAVADTLNGLEGGER